MHTLAQSLTVLVGVIRNVHCAHSSLRTPVTPTDHPPGLTSLVHNNTHVPRACKGDKTVVAGVRAALAELSNCIDSKERGRRKVSG